MPTNAAFAIATLIAIIGVALSPAGAFAAGLISTHRDIMPYQQDGQLHSGYYDLDLDEPVLDVRVFSRGMPLGGGATNLWGTNDPGFFAVLQSPDPLALPGLADLQFNALSIPHPTLSFSSNLWYWDGEDDNGDGNYADDVDFTLAPAGVEFVFSKSGGLAATLTGVDADVPGFFIDRSDSAGGIHKHIAMSARGGNQPVPGLPPDGLYLVAIELTMPDEALTPSDPIYLVMSTDFERDINGDIIMNGANPVFNTDSEQAAVDWVTAGYITTPGDVDDDGDADVDDIDALMLASRAGLTDAVYDVNGDQVVDALDVTHLVTNIIGLLPGDTQGDFDIDNDDIFGILGANKFGAGQSAAVWSQGDFDNDADVDNDDIFLILGTNSFGAGSYAASGGPGTTGATIPEPGAAVIVMLGCGAALARRRRGR